MAGASLSTKESAGAAGNTITSCTTQPHLPLFVAMSVSLMIHLRRDHKKRGWCQSSAVKTAESSTFVLQTFSHSDAFTGKRSPPDPRFRLVLPALHTKEEHSPHLFLFNSLLSHCLHTVYYNVSRQCFLCSQCFCKSSVGAASCLRNIESVRSLLQNK